MNFFHTIYQLPPPPPPPPPPDDPPEKPDPPEALCDEGLYAKLDAACAEKSETKPLNITAFIPGLREIFWWFQT